MSEGRDPYRVLGVARTATVREIRAAYVERARRAHPDLVGRHVLDVMRALNDAWAVLKDGARRAAYDASTAREGLESPDSSSGVTAGASSNTAGSRTGGDPPKPFWTGAAGPPPGRRSGPVLDFGMYAGWSLGEILRHDRGYLHWLRDRGEGKALRPEIARLLEPVIDGTDTGRRWSRT